MLKRILWGVLLFMGVSTMAHAADQSLDDIIAGAKAEGSLVWYTGSERDPAQAMLTAFQKKYPFIKAEMVRASSAELANRVEAELAFIMKHRLAGPHCTMFDVLNATDFVVPALEILDTRIERVDPQTKSTRKIFDTIADNAANAGIVLGGRPIRPLDADLRWIGALCYRNGQLEETGLAAGVLNHPATAVAWLANKIAPNGLALEAGQVVLAGSFIRPIETRKGDTIQADYGAYGSVSCYFA